MWIMERKARPGDKGFLHTPTEKVILERCGPVTRAKVQTPNARNILARFHGFSVVEDEVVPPPVAIPAPPPPAPRPETPPPLAWPEMVAKKHMASSARDIIAVIKEGRLDECLTNVLAAEHLRPRPRVTVERAIRSRQKTIKN